MSSNRKADYIHTSWSVEGLESLIDDEGGFIDPRIYTDENIYELEQERILRVLGFCWVMKVICPILVII